MCAWLVVNLRKGSHWLVQNFLFVHGLNEAVRWAYGHPLLVFENAFDLFLMLLEGHAIMGVVVTMMFDFCVGLLILVGTDLPLFDIFRSSQKRVANSGNADVRAENSRAPQQQDKSSPRRKDSK
jgi:hypothetical protein